jgi:hypothetical protein
VKKIVASLALALVALTGCSSMETQADEQGIRYEGSVIFAQAPTFKECQAPSLQSFGDPGDGTYIYPAGQRTLKFSDDPGSDAPPITVSAPSPGGGQPITLTVSGVVTFTPNFGDCATFQRFHEQIGRKFTAWTPEGWAQMIGTYIKDPTDRAADNAALGSNWVALASDESAKAAWERAVAEALPAMIKTLSGGDYFTINGVLLQRPELPGDVVAAIQRTEAARQEAQTAEQVRRAAETFPGGIAAYQAFQQQQAINDAIRSGNVKVLPVPQGSPIIVSPGG